MVASEVNNLDAEKTTICKLHQKQQADGTTQYWYSDASDEGDDTSNAGCTASAITGRLEGELEGTKLAHGKLKHSQEISQTIDKNTPQDDNFHSDNGELSERVINTKTPNSKYYYLVVKYPNKNENQAEGDAGIYPFFLTNSVIIF